MRFFHILHFESDSGHVTQIAVHTPSGGLYSRASNGGEFPPWRRLDVDRKVDGTLDEKVYEAVVAERADVAGRWRTHMTMTCKGDVSGRVSFDGSQNVECLLSIPALSRLEEIEKRLGVLERPDENDQWS